MRVLLLTLALILTLPAAEYIAPKESRSLFARDRVPVDTDTMRELSGYLTDLARRATGNEAAQHRATAQLLALAIQLDPANRAAHTVNQALVDGEPVDAGNRDLRWSLGQAWGITAWLLDREAGEAGNLLGNLLRDGLRVIDPRHPLGKQHDPNGERARWLGVVGSLQHYRGPPPEDPATPPANPSPPPEPKPSGPPIQLEQAVTRTPLFLDDQAGGHQLRVAPVSMQVVDSADFATFSFVLRPEIESELMVTARENVRRILQRSWPLLPEKKVAILAPDGGGYAAKNGGAISGPAALLMTAALRGNALRQDVVLVGELDQRGILSRPRRSWDYLRALQASGSGRLLVPPDFLPDLRTMLVLEDPQFFLRWEVLAVSSLQAALSLASVDGDPEGLVESSRLFGELRKIGRGKDVGQLCVNSHVRERLRQIDALTPFHVSASMLLVQGDGAERPTRTSREVTARILRAAIEQLTVLGEQPLDEIPVNQLGAAAANTRPRINQLANRFDAKDLDLLREADALTRQAEQVARALRAATKNAQGELVYQNVPVSTYYQRLQTNLAAYRAKLAPFTREAIPAPAPGTPRNSD